MSAGSAEYDDFKLHLHVLGQDHEIASRAHVGPTRAQELLPLARAISEGVTAIAVAHEEAEGKRISCAKGCGACCQQLVPVSPLEAARLAEVVEAMPRERRREIVKRFEKAVKRLEQVGLLDPRRPRGEAALVSTKTDPKEAWEDASRRYFEAKIPCPMLEDGACSIYPERPTVCREYLVTTPAERCATLGEGVRTTPRPLRMHEALTATTNELFGREDVGLPLTLSLEWAAAHRDAFRGEGDGEEMAMALVAAIQSADEEA
ncbi:MAG: YkgJ family cysteine cluster protein [Polyangiaceae bacterium]